MLRFAVLAALSTAAVAPAQGFGSFFTLTNDATDNEVQVGVSFFGRTFSLGRFSTGGTGNAGGLGSQGALDASHDWRHIVAVNPGSDDITLFRRFGPFLWRRDVESTGGTMPTSVDIYGNYVYALNAGSDDVTAFRMRRGDLQSIGQFPLSGAGVAAAQVGVDPSGRWVVVTERATNQILVFPIQRDGSLGTAVVNASAAPTPFGFEFRSDGTLIVSEADGGQPGLSATSSYEIQRDGTLRTISAAVGTNQTAACWIAIPRGGRFAYTTNTASGTLTGYSVDRSGALTRLDANGITGQLAAGAQPIDFDFNGSGRLLFVLDRANDEIVALRRDSRGGLQLINGSVSLPDGAAGLIAR